MYRRILILALFAGMLMPQLSLAQDPEAVTFALKVSKERLGVNERLRADFEMNRDGDNFIPPDFAGFRVLIGPSQSISSSWINGVRSYSKTYSYVLEPTEKGTLTIGQASIVIGGETYKTIPKEITVTDAVDNPNGTPSSDDVAARNLHLVAEVSKANPYMNEPVSVVYKLYFSSAVGVSNFRPLDNPKYNNFWSQEIPFSKYNVENGTYNGQPYRYVVLKRVVLYPQKSGALDIEPLALDVTLDIPTERRDFFGNRIYTTTHKNVSAGKRTIQVKPLPLQGQPEGFTGAVGQFDFKVETTKKSLNASESLQAKVTVSGKGNLKLFQLPDLNLPSALEVYDPEFREQVRTTISGMQGSVSEDYTIVPSFQGKYPIPEIEFTYFDPDSESYKKLRSEEITIQVLEGPTPAIAATPTPDTERKAPVIRGDQFHFIKLQPNLSARARVPFFGTQKYWVLLLSPVLLIPLVILARKRRQRHEQDVEGSRVRRANKLARRYLGRAKNALGDQEEFYVALERALHNYLKAKLKIETSEFSKDKIREVLEKRDIAQETREGFIALLESCEMARYSPFSIGRMQQDYDKASSVISALDKVL
ncbi:BatD family protein [Robiginitalea sp. M366]|uniref:BatD family protein n=1 Tax=Robiginitalea aestuariiviva TaxID=3036903 RepID=UPI00240DEAC6|nr:BatD family protein [Robiginitalea aestuariiviva]MDG1571621.1 BatD family protein [Robiginitalea aestuariiviva]